MATVPLTKEYFEECFFVKDNDLFWREDRPIEHFASILRHKAWYKKWAGQRAGNQNKGQRRIQMPNMNVRVEHIIDILTDNVQHKSKDTITFNDVFRMMNYEPH